MSKILDFKKPGQPFEIRSKTETKAEIVLYGAVGGGMFEEGIEAKKVVDEIRKLPKTVNELEIRINSPGGDVFEGVAIYNVLKQHPAKKTVYVDGLAASIASVIALAGDEIVMGEGALFMIHLPWTWAMGNRMDLENTQNRLVDVEEQMISIYKKKTGMERSELRNMLEKETWMDADQTIEMGFAHTKSEQKVAIAASALDRAAWINKKPKIVNSKEDQLKEKMQELKNKISAKLARK